MPVRFASFNVENLFARPRALNQITWAAGQPALDAYREFNSLVANPAYSAADKSRMKKLLLDLEVYRSDNGIIRRNRPTSPRWAWLRANRGSFDVDREATGIEIVATGRKSWTGWLELVTEPVDEIATQMTARVIDDLAADVIAVVEAENRPSLKRFSDELLATPYRHIMLIDGNDTRGIDVGIMTKTDVEITLMKSNVDTRDPVLNSEQLFSRDCAEYRCQVPGGAIVWVLINHFKSQSGGGELKRQKQAQGVKEIVTALIASGEPNIVVMGDLNEGPKVEGQPPENLKPLFDQHSPLVDIYTLPSFDPGPRPGTFQSSGISNRFDYILVSPALADHVVHGGIERRGLWGTPTNKNPPEKWDIYPEIKSSQNAASDHAAIFVDIDV